jgi:hypothetical protein
MASLPLKVNHPEDSSEIEFTMLKEKRGKEIKV